MTSSVPDRTFSDSSQHHSHRNREYDRTRDGSAEGHPEFYHPGLRLSRGHPPHPGFPPKTNNMYRSVKEERHSTHAAEAPPHHGAHRGSRWSYPHHPSSYPRSSAHKHDGAHPRSMERNPHQPLHQREGQVGDTESADFDHNVLSLPVGSFADESPPRGRSIDSDDGRHSSRRRSSPRASPIQRRPPMPLYRSSQFYPHGPTTRHPHSPGRSHRYPQESPHGHPQPHAPSHPYLSYMYPHYGYKESGQWKSYHAEDPYGRGAQNPSHEGKTRGTPAARFQSSVSTPEKNSCSEGVFRSPPSQLKRSPSPAIPGLGSFGVDTPGGTLGDFSPMDLADEPLPAMRISSVGSDQQERSPLHRTSSSDLRDPPQKKKSSETSPFTGFLREFTPHGSRPLEGVSRSPLTSTCDPRPRPKHGPYPTQQPVLPPHPEHRTKDTSEPKTFRSSPLVSQNDAKPRRLWSQDSRSAKSGMRIELGRGSQRSLDELNNRMRAQNQRTMPLPHHTPHHPNGIHHVPYYRPPPMATPHKAPPHALVRHAPPPLPPPGPQLSRAHVPQPNLPVASRPGHSRSSKSPTPPKTMQSAGKENDKGGQRPPPCKCKKSRCLKLYCDCFGAEVYCNGCNCVDCQNLPAFEDVRIKAIKDIRAKNPNAFKPRFDVAQDTTGLSQSGHNTGCKCSKTGCLKKYCECFKAGALCCEKCKCKGCFNRAGSQKLIDARRKMKDENGAKFAMKVAQEVWRGQPQSTTAHPTPVTKKGSHTHPPALIQPNPHSGLHRPHLPPIPHPHHHFMRTHYMPGQVGYSPMGMHQMTPGYPDPRSLALSNFPVPPHPHTQEVRPHVRKEQGDKRDFHKITPGPTPKASTSVDAENPSRKKRKVVADVEKTELFFGTDAAPLSKKIALAIFSFLPNKDVQEVTLVCKTWKKLAEDGELWKFPEVPAKDETQ